jgi:hypothetical protein
MSGGTVVGLALITTLTACSGQSTSDTSTVATSTPAATTAVAESASKVSANDASQAELVAALTAAGVPNAERWAQEVMEYRPYASEDAALQKLQDNLAKYNPDPSTLQAILNALGP